MTMPLPHKKDGETVDLQRQPYPGDVCQVSAEHPNPTPFQVACAVLNVFSRHDQVLLVSHSQFNKGWSVGVERDLGDQLFPMLPDGASQRDLTVDEETYNAQRAFTLGLVAGLVAEQDGYTASPFCIMEVHRGECQLYDAQGKFKRMATNEVPPFITVDGEVVDNPEYSTNPAKSLPAR